MIDRRGFLKAMGFAAPAAVVAGAVLAREPLSIRATSNEPVAVNGDHRLDRVVPPPGPVMCRVDMEFLVRGGAIRRGQHVSVECPAFRAGGRITSVRTHIDTGQLLSASVAGACLVEWLGHDGVVGPAEVTVKIDGEDTHICREIELTEEAT